MSVSASGSGMITANWGPMLWHTLHTISMNYPVRPTPDQRTQYRAFMRSLGHVLPCGLCRRAYPANLAETVSRAGDPYASRASFARFIYDLHCTVSRHIADKRGTTYVPPAYQSVCDYYERMRAGKCSVDDYGCVRPQHEEYISSCRVEAQWKVRGAPERSRLGAVVQRVVDRHLPLPSKPPRPTPPPAPHGW